MSDAVQFNRSVASWGANILKDEIPDDVGYVISTILSLYYPVNALMGAKFSYSRLGEGQVSATSHEMPDLLLQMREAGGDEYIEVILCSTVCYPFYAGHLFGNDVELSDDIVNGHHVLISSNGKYRYRYEFDGSKYSLTEVQSLTGEVTNIANVWRVGAKRYPQSKFAA
ncbi:hypothetical protein [Labrenzia sp. PHM005]|uniref:hypothetical protein n=1 Tax=Labrenzia sp. PHM005 TaxID=2590016 RepID=UPI0011402134|nr:hypothetical protein [Labrenzia sp. PHM005]QDG76410.1 hypothetical protein FJ695_11300 [Labrenzia sp. PHM005]